MMTDVTKKYGMEHLPNIECACGGKLLPIIFKIVEGERRDDSIIIADIVWKCSSCKSVTGREESYAKVKTKKKNPT